MLSDELAGGTPALAMIWCSHFLWDTDGRVADFSPLIFSFQREYSKLLATTTPPFPPSHLKALSPKPKLCPIPGQAPGCFGGNNRMLTPSSWSSVRGGDSTVWGSGLLNFPVIPLGKSSSSFLGKENGHHLVLFRCKGCLWSCGSERAWHG